MPSDDPKKILVLMTQGMSLKDWFDLGLSDRELTIYKHLSDLGYRLTFLSFGDQSDVVLAKSEWPWLSVEPMMNDRSRMLRSIMVYVYPIFWCLKNRRRLSDAKILLTNQMWGSWLAVLLKYVAGIPFILRCGYERHYTAEQEKIGPIKLAIIWVISKISYICSNRILVTSNLIRDYIVKNFEIEPAKIAVHPNAIDVALFAPGNSVVKSSAERVLFLGRLRPEKNLDILIRVTNSAGIGLDIIGQGPLLPQLQILSTELKADVTFLGTISNRELPSRLIRYGIFVLIESYSGSPKALLEAMSCGLAVIGSNVAGINSIIADGENGLLVDISEESLKNALLKLQRAPDLRARLGQNARNFVLEHCSFGSLTALYHYLISSEAK